MKVVAFNGSPNEKGNTYAALRMVAAELEKENITVEIIHVGDQTIQGCTSCGGCIRAQNQKCAISGDPVNQWIEKMIEADGILLGSPVYYSSVNGTMKAFLDRAFFVATVNGGLFRHKVGAAVVAVRRSGGLPAFEELNRFICFSEMLMPTANYWNVIYGGAPGEAEKDEEGKQIMRILGKNMTWLMKLVENGKERVPAPPPEAKVFMSFIR